MKILDKEYINNLFIDGWRVKTEQNIFEEFEKREPGYFNGCRNAFEHAMQLKENVSYKDILKIHELSVTDVKNTNYGDGQTEDYDYLLFELDPDSSKYKQKKSKDIRNLNACYILKFGENLTEKGVKEFSKIIENMLGWETYNTMKNYYKELSPSSEGNKTISLDKYGNVNQKKTANNFNNRCSEWKDLKSGIIKYGDWLLYFIHLPESEKSLNQDKKLIQQIIENTLKKYYEDLKSIRYQEDKLIVIIRTIVCLERLHPFSDANGRTFSMVLLNKFLIDNKFDPVLQDNPNKIDGYAIDEIKEEIILGMFKTNLFNNTRDDIKQSFLKEMYKIDQTKQTVEDYKYAIKKIYEEMREGEFNK
jgi:prophage maintenance system killer protein